MAGMRWLLMCIMALTGILQSEAQTVPKLFMGASPSSEITLEKCSAAGVPGLARVFDIVPRVSDLQSSCFIVSNQSERTIIGIGVQWTIVDSSGKKINRPFKTHSYLAQNFAPLAAPHQRLIVMPAMFIQEPELQSNSGLIVSSPGRQFISLFSNAAQVHAEIDSIIFGDGEVAGPNALRLHAEIQARKDAADVVVRHVHASAAVFLRSSGQMPSEPPAFAQHVHEFVKQIDGQLSPDHPIAGALHQLSEPSANDLVTERAGRFAQDLLHTRHFRGVFELIQSIPSPPVFYRKDGQKL